jgi:hypothetical protein
MFTQTFAVRRNLGSLPFQLSMTMEASPDRGGVSEKALLLAKPMQTCRKLKKDRQPDNQQQWKEQYSGDKK